MLTSAKLICQPSSMANNVSLMSSSTNYFFFLLLLLIYIYIYSCLKPKREKIILTGILKFLDEVQSLPAQIKKTYPVTKIFYIHFKYLYIVVLRKKNSKREKIKLTEILKFLDEVQSLPAQIKRTYPVTKIFYINFEYL